MKPYPVHPDAQFGRSPPWRQSGSGAIEFAITAVPILLLGLGGIELAQWFYVKQAVSLALLDAARAGITQNARPQAIRKAFDTALRPLYPPTSGRSSAQRVSARHSRLREAGLPPWQIQIISPAPAAFIDFADGSLPISRQTGLDAINNNYQKEQDDARRAMGWAGGAGPASGQTIYQANYLTLKLTYPHKPLTPGIRAMLRMLGNTVAGYSGQALVQGYLPVTQEIALTMQSHPVDWPELADGTVVGPARALPAPAPVGACHGLWCFKQAGGPPVDTGEASQPDALADPADAATGAPAPADPAAGLDVFPGDPACGVTLCCIA